MENKPQNLFEKIDKQGEQIEDISKKLEGISINDLYALAKRTWDYGDFQTAQKYYNHISLLRPLDWEAPLYASLCNFKGYHDMFFWTKVPNQKEKIFVSTIKYIYNLELEHDKKESEMTRCIDVIKNEMVSIKDHYFNYKKDYDNYFQYNKEYDNLDLEYIYTLENFFVNVYKEIRTIELEAIKILTIEIANQLLDLIVQTNKISTNISKEIYVELKSLTTKEINIDFDSIYEKSRKEQDLSKEKLSLEEMNQIKLKGIMFFEYKDKVISKRINRFYFILGVLIVVSSLTGICISILGRWYWVFAFILPFIYGFLSIIKSIIQKDRIKCSSLLNTNREKNRLTSDGNITLEHKFNFMGLFAFIMTQLSTWSGFYMGLFALTEKDNKYALPYFIIVIVDILFSFLGYIRTINEHYSKYDGTYSYYYKGKYYKF